VSGYVVEREIGRGGMAVVYAGRQEGLDRPVALKVLAAHLADDPAFRDRFLREARIACRLDQPHLVRAYDIAEVDGRPCIVMELLPGATLEHGRLTRQEAADVAAALAYAHARGVVHRDLKPANLLRAGDGSVKIADFGIARALEETMVTQVGTVLGTLRYLAPEQAAGKIAGPAADVYSLGVVLDELLEPRSAADRALIARCCAAEPADRPTAAEVAEALSPSAATVVKAPASQGWRRLPWLLAAAAVAAVAAAVAVALSGGHDAPATVKPVPHATTAAQEARNLEAWLRTYSR
jgi:serine/threonine-protein kinase